MAYCCVPLCVSKSKKGSGISFHEIPNNLELREKWLKVISRKDWVPNSTSNYSRVCSKHFTSADFSVVTKIRRLKPNAVPSVFDYQNYLETNEEEGQLKIKKGGKQLDTENLATTVMSPHSANQGFLYDITVIENSMQPLEPANKPTPQEQESNMNVQMLCEPVYHDLSSTGKVQRGKQVFRTYSKRKQLEELDSMPGPGLPPPPARQGPIYKDDNILNVPVFMSGNSQTYLEPVDSNTDADCRTMQLPERKRWLKKCREMQNQIASLREKADTLFVELQILRSDAYVNNVLKLKELAGQRETSAIFLLDQIYNYTAEHPMWTKTTIQESNTLRNISSELYEHLRERKLLKLPGPEELGRKK